MFDLPKIETEIEVSIRGDIKLYLAPLSDQEYFALSEDAELRTSEDGERLVYRLSRAPHLFAAKLVRAEGIEVDGGSFDASDPAHIARIPQPWKVIALTRVVRYSMGLTAEELGNSERPASSSKQEETLSPA
ncbi:MAG TPA: hypothetical protein VFI91_13255 [Longimicrobiaceae bacterium]|nr:hypothetical protein [Longimicrobiaceae bacterium]